MIGKLLVVDDEIWFREGLVQLIASNQLGWEVVGEASDGEEAMRATELYKPDLIITDINMPVMNGLQFMEWLSGTYPDIRVIILTGYRDFEYAQRALRYGAVEFLLKPFSLDEAYRALHKAYEELRLKQLKLRVSKQEEQNELFRAALFGLPCERSLRENWEHEWREAEFCVLQIQGYDLPGKNYTSSDIDLLHYTVTTILQELLQNHPIEGLYFPLRKEAFAFLLKPVSAGGAYRQSVQEALHRFSELKIRWLEMGTVRRFDEMKKQYETYSELGDGSYWLNDQQDNVVLQAQQYIQRHYQSDCSLQTVAAHVHVTPNYLSNLFKRETGMGLTNYVGQLRINEAKRLLQHSRLRMTEIAERVGFDNSSYFTVVFKQMTGESPREFRKQFKERRD